MHEREHAFLILLGEILGYIHLAYRLAERTVHDTYRTFPQRTRLLGTGQYTTVEIKTRHVDLRRQVRCSTFDDLPTEQGLQVFQRFIA